MWWCLSWQGAILCSEYLNCCKFKCDPYIALWWSWNGCLSECLCHTYGFLIVVRIQGAKGDGVSFSGRNWWSPSPLSVHDMPVGVFPEQQHTAPCFLYWQKYICRALTWYSMCKIASVTGHLDVMLLMKITAVLLASNAINLK